MTQTKAPDRDDRDRVEIPGDDKYRTIRTIIRTILNNLCGDLPCDQHSTVIFCIVQRLERLNRFKMRFLRAKLLEELLEPEIEKCLQEL